MADQVVDEMQQQRIMGWLGVPITSSQRSRRPCWSVSPRTWQLSLATLLAVCTKSMYVNILLDAILADPTITKRWIHLGDKTVINGACW